MRASFANQPSPLLIGVIREKTVRAAIAAIRNSEVDGATGIDLHLSCLDPEYQNEQAIREIIRCTELPVLALNYNQHYDYSGFETLEEPRIALLLEAVRAGVSAIDMQGYSFDLKSKTGYYGDPSRSFAKDGPKEIVTDPAVIGQQMELIRTVHEMGAEVLISTHPQVPMSCEQVTELALFLEERGPDVIKIVTPCENEEQLIESFRTMVTLKKKLKTKVHFHCSGRAGALSRVINPLLGGHLLFCSDRFSESSNFEQPDLKTVAGILEGFRKI